MPHVPDTHESFRFHGHAIAPQNEVPLSADKSPCRVMRGGSVTSRTQIQPTYRGTVELSDNSFLVVFGYINNNTEAVDAAQTDYPNPTLNTLLEGTKEGRLEQLPEILFPGDNLAFAFRTFGENVTWALYPHCGGGVVSADYNDVITVTGNEELLGLAVLLVRFFPPALLRYLSLDPANVILREAIRFASEVFDPTNFRGAGDVFVNEDTLRFTDLPNESISGDTFWWQKNHACRIEGGMLQAHGNTARVSRILRSDFDKELAKGILFSLRDNAVTSSNLVQPANPVGGEDNGEMLGVSENGDVVVSSSITVDRFHVFLIDSEDLTAEQIGTVDAPGSETGGWARCVEIFNDGTLLIVAGTNSTEYYVYDIDKEAKTVTFRNTFTYQRFDDLVAANNARVLLAWRPHQRNDMLIVGIGGVGNAALNTISRGETHILTTDDDWQTVTLKKQVDAPPPDTEESTTSFNGAHTSPDGSKIVIGSRNYDDNAGRIYVARTTDDWDTYSLFRLPDPPDPLSAGDNLGAFPVISVDGYVVVSGRHDTDKFGFTSLGLIEVWTFNDLLNRYEHFQQIAPPVAVRANDLKFGRWLSFNGPSNRFAVSTVSAAGDRELFIYGRSRGEFKEISRITGAAAGAATSAFMRVRWDESKDVLFSSDIGAAGGGGFIITKYPETP